MGRRVRYHFLTVLVLAVSAAGCATRAPAPAGGSATPAPPSAPATGPPGTATVRPGVGSPSPPGFVGEVSAVTAADVAQSWRPGCPVGPDQLTRLRLGYWGFDGQPHIGTMVVHRSVASDVITVFGTLYRERFPIRRLQPVDSYAGSDDRSMDADNTSGFNCRRAVSSGPAKWSAHAYGQAIDVNPVENPYLIDGMVLPPAGATYADRSRYRPGMAVPDGTLVDAFAAVGWRWGGAWRSSPDYQHFSKTGG